MKTVEVSSQTPVAHQKTIRPMRWRGLTSVRAGVINPIAYFHMFREDAASGTISVQVKMEETVKPLLNGVRCKVMAHLYPYSADPRFSGIDELNASYTKQADFAGSPPPPFIPTAIGDYNNNEILYVLGSQFNDGDTINDSVVRAYNTIVNSRRAVRSSKLAQRATNAFTLAQAFWHDPNRWEIVPDFDQKMIEGELTVPLTGRARVSGIGASATAIDAAILVNGMRETGVAAPVQYQTAISTLTAGQGQHIRTTGDTASDFLDVWAELADSGVTISMANMELAKKTAAYARLRDTYVGANEDWVIDMLMDGIRTPDSQLKNPILLGSAVGTFGMVERFAADYANLDKSYTRGMLSLSLNIRTPPINPGGIVLVTCEIVPESLPELGYDPFLYITDQGEWPETLADTLDPEKVELVVNKQIDAFHALPDGLFGYAPLNWRWATDKAQVGGKFSDGPTPSTSEERYRMWQVRPTNPTLADDFYLCPSPFPHDVFADTAADPFEVVTLATIQMRGNTVFGDRLAEDHGSYDEVISIVDQERIVQAAAERLTHQQKILDEKKAAEAVTPPAIEDEKTPVKQKKEAE